MDFRILGPLEVLDDHGVVTLGGRKPRAVLAVLLLSANEPVSPERLARALWGDDAPAGAVKTVQVHVSRLRKALDHNDVLTTTPGGYCLEVQPGELDAQRFEQLVDEGRRALAAGRPEEASALLREAAGLWRGPPLADLAFEPFAQTEIDRLEEQRLAALEARVEADAAAGRHAELVPELWRLVAEHPTRERLAGQLMVALYRCGRQTEALDAYRSARGTLAGEIGVEPGPELRALQEAVLRHDPTLELRAAADLPHALESAATAPLAGRDDELRWLRARWQEARGGAGRLIVLAGPRGMGKTRLAAALAVEAHADGATVLYASGTGPAQACVDAAADAAGAPRPVLLVVDDTDRAGEAVLAVLRELSGSDVLVLATATHPEALEPLEPQGVLFLKQLGSAGIGAIAALYVSDEGAEGVPIEWLLGASGGVPARVHDVASQWARQESTRRVAAGRAELRSMEDELAGSVVQLQSAHDWYDAGAGEDGERVVCPFKGLASFEEADAPYFFGRERLVAELVARLVGAPLLGVVGPSGSGKSSVVRAGLLPALAGGVLPGSQEWPRVVLRPGEHPEQELRMALDGAGAGRFVLAVDQFEETFTVCRDEAERGRFIAELVRESRRKTGAVVIVAAARRLLRALRRATPSSRACWRQTTCSSGRCATSSCAGPSSARPNAPACTSSPISSRRWSTTSRRSPGRCRSCRRRCSSYGSAATGGTCASGPTRTPAACWERSRGSPSRASAGSTKASAPSPAPSSCAWPRSRSREGWSAGACRSRSSRAAARTSPPSSGSSRTPACSRSARAPSSSRTRRCCASGRACATGSRRTARTSGSTGA